MSIVWYSESVKKPFYASGFLYHEPTGQILLQQFGTGDDSKLTFFRGSSNNGESPEIVFQRSVEKALGTTIPASSIRPIYDYVHEKQGEQYVFYVDVPGVTPKEYKSKNKTEWYPLSKISKYDMSEQTRHDIMIGERVIRATH
jgi:hypothetical protein